MSNIPGFSFSVPLLQGPAGSASGPYNPFFNGAHVAKLPHNNMAPTSTTSNIPRTSFHVPLLHEPASTLPGSSSGAVPRPGPVFIPLRPHVAPRNGITYNDNMILNNIPNACNDTIVIPDQPLVRAQHSHSDFVAITPEQKQAVLQHILRSHPHGHDLQRLTSFHVNISGYRTDYQARTKSELITAFEHHSCTDICLIQCEEAEDAKLYQCTPLTEATFNICADVLRLRSSTILKRKNDSDNARSNKKLRPSVTEGEPSEQVIEWPSILPDTKKLAIMRESFEAGNNAALKPIECSFCGSEENCTDIHSVPCDELDISVLTGAVEHLRRKFRQPCIETLRCSTIKNSCNQICSFCYRDIHNVKSGGVKPSKELVHLPLQSYANGTWVGDVPEALRDLTFLEEQCIARARATRCMFKLELGPSGQFASRGNVCIFPQDPGPMVTCLLPPLSQIQDEVCVILVGSPHTEITIDMLTKTPLLIRRSKIIAALRWLKANNPLYSDLDIDHMEINASSYPEHGVPNPIQAVIRTEANSEGASYTEWSMSYERFQTVLLALQFTDPACVHNYVVAPSYRPELQINLNAVHSWLEHSCLRGDDVMRIFQDRYRNTLELAISPHGVTVLWVQQVLDAMTAMNLSKIAHVGQDLFNFFDTLRGNFGSSTMLDPYIGYDRPGKGPYLHIVIIIRLLNKLIS